MNTVVMVVAIVGIAVAFGFFVLEVVKWRQGASIISRYHKVLRVVLFVLVEGLMVMMLFGVTTGNQRDPITELLYWSGCTLVACSVAIVAWLDLREVLKETRKVVRSMFRGQSEDKK